MTLLHYSRLSLLLFSLLSLAVTADQHHSQDDSSSTRPDSLQEAAHKEPSSFHSDFDIASYAERKLEELAKKRHQEMQKTKRDPFSVINASENRDTKDDDPFMEGQPEPGPDDVPESESDRHFRRLQRLTEAVHQLTSRAQSKPMIATTRDEEEENETHTSLNESEEPDDSEEMRPRNEIRQRKEQSSPFYGLPGKHQIDDLLAWRPAGKPNEVNDNELAHSQSRIYPIENQAQLPMGGSFVNMPPQNGHDARSAGNPNEQHPESDMRQRPSPNHRFSQTEHQSEPPNPNWEEMPSPYPQSNSHVYVNSRPPTIRSPTYETFPPQTHIIPGRLVMDNSEEEERHKYEMMNPYSKVEKPTVSYNAQSSVEQNIQRRPSLGQPFPLPLPLSLGQQTTQMLRPPLARQPLPSPSTRPAPGRVHSRNGGGAPRYDRPQKAMHQRAMHQQQPARSPNWRPRDALPSRTRSWSPRHFGGFPFPKVPSASSEMLLSNPVSDRSGNRQYAVFQADPQWQSSMYSPQRSPSYPSFEYLNWATFLEAPTFSWPTYLRPPQWFTR